MAEVLPGRNACEIARRGVDRPGEVVAQSFIDMYTTTTVDQPGFSVDRSSTSERRTVFGAIALVIQQVLGFLHRAACSLRGHELRMKFEPKRLSLRCVECGFNTRGWALDVKMPPVARQPRIRVVARTTPAAVKSAVKTQPIPVPSQAADHADAA